MVYRWVKTVKPVKHRVCFHFLPLWGIYFQYFFFFLWAYIIFLYNIMGDKLLPNFDAKFQR